VVGAFGEDGVEADILDDPGHVVVVCELGVTEYSRALAEQLAHQVAVLVYLGDEFLPVVQEGHAVIVGFGDELDASGGREVAEAVEHFGGPPAELLDDGSGQ